MKAWLVPNPLPRLSREQLFVLCSPFLAAAFMAGCSSSSSSYFPLEHSRWWYYEIIETILDERRDSRYVVVNSGKGVLDSRDVFLQSAQITSLDYLRYKGDGVERIASRRPGMTGIVREVSTRVVLPDTLEPGRKWRVSTTLGLIESRTFARTDRVVVRRYPVEIEKTIVANDASVRVEAGYFDDCIRVESEGRAVISTDRGNSQASVLVRVTEWYAKDVGLVRLKRVESADSPFLKTGTQTWELAAYGS